MLRASTAEYLVVVSGIDRLEADLAAAARRLARARADAAAQRRDGCLRALAFARLGFSLADLDRLTAAERASDVPVPLRARLQERLEGERRRLARLARAGSARYDLDRHLAIREALAWMAGGPTGAGLCDERLPGSVANGRFRRAVRRAPPLPALRRNAARGG